MPRIFLSETDRQKARLTAAIYAQMRMLKVNTTDLGECWGISQQGAAYRIREGKVSVLDLFNAQQLLQFTDAELVHLIRGDRKPVEEGNEKAGSTDQSTPARNRNR